MTPSQYSGISIYHHSGIYKSLVSGIPIIHDRGIYKSLVSGISIIKIKVYLTEVENNSETQLVLSKYSELQTATFTTKPEKILYKSIVPVDGNSYENIEADNGT